MFLQFVAPKKKILISLLSFVKYNSPYMKQQSFYVLTVMFGALLYSLQACIIRSRE